MNICPEGKIHTTPAEFYARAQEAPVRLINDWLIRGTPQAFLTYQRYCDFLHVVGKSLRVHPASLLIRGSCKIGFSISPAVSKPKKPSKLWREMTPKSDLDLAIVDAPLYYQLDAEVRDWEEHLNAHEFSGDDFEDYTDRQRDRFFYVCRDYRLPDPVCVSFRDAIADISTADFCDCDRDLSAFVYRDWWSLRKRYEFDLRQLCQRVSEGKLDPPPADQKI